jgi:phosphoribosyl 1,2-cyclic phosphodiesterase/ActR/RegA family two-component response regulator
MKTALLIEDDAEARQSVGVILREAGWKVFEAEDGESGIQLAKQHRPAVVVCDLLMPRCNGFQVIRALRADQALRHCQIIVTSGRDYAVDRYNALEAGADEYVTKPFRASLLLELMGKQEICEVSRPTLFSAIPAAAPAKSYLRFWGVRGSLPTPGHDTVFYGGNTSCVEVRADGEIIILDAGTGIRGLGLELAKEFPDTPIHVSLLLTHTHWDHIQGFPFFAPVYGKGNLIRVYGFEGARDGLATILSSQMESPYFPVGIKELPGTVSIEELKTMQFRVGDVRVSCCFVNHPGICVGYRLDTSRGSLAFLPDCEPYLTTPPYIPEGKDEREAVAYATAQDARLVNFLRGVDHLILDSQYDSEEYLTHRGWGHGSLNEVVALALRARARCLYLFHHDPAHDDTKISHMVSQARMQVSNASGDLRVEAAREGETVELDAHGR